MVDGQGGDWQQDSDGNWIPPDPHTPADDDVQGSSAGWEDPDDENAGTKRWALVAGIAGAVVIIGLVTGVAVAGGHHPHHPPPTTVTNTTTQNSTGTTTTDTAATTTSTTGVPPTTPPTTPVTNPTPATNPQALASLESIVPAGGDCGGTPALEIGSEITVDSDSTECQYSDGTNTYLLDAYQFNSTSEATSYFDWAYGHNLQSTASTCGSIPQEPCLGSWQSASYPAADGQVMIEDTSSAGSGVTEVYWILPAQNAVFGLVTNAGDLSDTVALAWFFQNVTGT